MIYTWGHRRSLDDESPEEHLITCDVCTGMHRATKDLAQKPKCSLQQKPWTIRARAQEMSLKAGDKILVLLSTTVDKVLGDINYRGSLIM